MPDSTSPSAARWPRPGGWWTNLWGALAFAGTVLAWFEWGPLTTLAGLILGSAVSGTLAVFVANQHPPVAWRQVATLAGLGAMTCLGFPAVVTVSGPVACGLVLLVLGTSPPAMTTMRHLTRRSTAVGPTAATEVAAVASPIYEFIDRDLTPDQVAAMDTPTLCHAWRRSYQGLGASQDPLEKAEVVRVRQLCLDALHERYPPAVAAWLAAGGRAASGPEKFLGEGGLSDVA